MKTIQRKAGWPEWAKFYARDFNYGAWLYDKEPHLSSIFPRKWTTDVGARYPAKKVRDALPGDAKTWRDSLRRIRG